jgi:hypothetical protein
MPHQIVFRGLGYGLIRISVFLVIMILLISMAGNTTSGSLREEFFVFALAIITLCAVIALGMISAKVQKATSFPTSFDRT